MIRDTFQLVTRIIILTVLMCSCKNTSTEMTRAYHTKSMELVKLPKYNMVFGLAQDSINTWALNGLGYYKFFNKTKDYKLDTLFCFNRGITRMVTTILTVHKAKDAMADGIDVFYGELIDNKWYFFSGAYITVPREESNTPLSYEELHEIALREVYSGYLTKSGEINEEWFTNHFENVGWCSTCKTKEEFQQSRLEGVAALWATRDTTQPIKYLKDTSGVLP